MFSRGNPLFYWLSFVVWFFYRASRFVHLCCFSLSRKERRILEDYERALKVMPSKKDREEIERLKEEVSEDTSLYYNHH